MRKGTGRVCLADSEVICGVFIFLVSVLEGDLVEFFFGAKGNVVNFKIFFDDVFFV